MCDPTLHAPANHVGFAPQVHAAQTVVQPVQSDPVQYHIHVQNETSAQYQGHLNYQVPTAADSQGMAVASLVLGIASIAGTCFYGLGVPLAILAVIFGFIARGRAKRGEGGGEGMALAGLICGFISLGIVAVFIVFIIFAMIVAALA